MTDEPKISDAEVLEFMRAHAEAVTKGNPGPLPPHMRPDTAAMERRSIEYTRRALAAFLAARVPEQKQGYAGAFENGEIAGFNACREAVLNGRADGK